MYQSIPLNFLTLITLLKSHSDNSCAKQSLLKKVVKLTIIEGLPQHMPWQCTLEHSNNLNLELII